MSRCRRQVVNIAAVLRFLRPPLRDRLRIEPRGCSLERGQRAFAAEVPRSRALEAFHHPTAYRPHAAAVAA
jgi:hypothetical protein